MVVSYTGNQKTTLPTSTRQPDPLIIGYDGEKFWLLDSFNVTSVEMMAAGYIAEGPERN